MIPLAFELLFYVLFEYHRQYQCEIAQCHRDSLALFSMVQIGSVESPISIISSYRTNCSSFQTSEIFPTTVCLV